MSVVASLLMVLGGLLSMVAGLGLVRLRTPYARIHAARKASPVAFLVAAIGAAIELGADDGAYLLIAAAAMVLTLPVGVHLLFRATHRSSTGGGFAVDELAPAEEGSFPGSASPGT